MKKSKFLILELKDLKATLNNFYSITVEKEKKFADIGVDITNLKDKFFYQVLYLLHFHLYLYYHNFL